MKKVIFLLIAYFLLLLTSCLLPSPLAADEVPIGDKFFFGNKGIDQIFGSTSSLINVLIPNIFLITGLIFLIILIISGFSVIVSAGSSNPEGAKKAKASATSAAVGLALVFAAYWLIQIIEYLTGINIFNPSF